MNTSRIVLRVNGVEREIEVEPRRLLADALREDLGLTGTHLGCEHGVCGACTVLIDGWAARSCLTLALQAEGAEITTVEALAPAGGLHPLQEAFRAEHALQCGFCTPGMLMLAADTIAEMPAADAAGVRAAMGANLCRCTGYEGIVAAVLRVLEERRQASASEAG